MSDLFVNDPLKFLRKDTDAYGNIYAFCPYRGRVLLTNKPEEEVRIYLLEFLSKNFTNIAFKVEALRLDISCYYKHQSGLRNFTYGLKPITIWEIKKINGASFSDTLKQINGYIKEHKLMFGAFFYNCNEMGYIDNAGKTKLISDKSELDIILNDIIAQVSKLFTPVYEIFQSAISADSQNIFNGIISLINVFNSTEARSIFKSKPTFHILANGRERELYAPEYDLEKDCIIKYTSPDNLEFYRGEITKLLSIR